MLPLSALVHAASGRIVNAIPDLGSLAERTSQGEEMMMRQDHFGLHVVKLQEDAAPLVCHRCRKIPMLPLA